MNEEYPDQGIEGQSQDLDTERSQAAVTPNGGELRPAAEVTLGPPTGDDRVDAAMAGLNRLAGAPAEEHVAVLEEVHGRLRDILGEVNEGTP
jgi:hypothetical protein